MQELKINPLFRDLIPELSADEYKQLEENLITEGCQDKLIVYEGQIVDGHNRYKICTANEIPFETKEMFFSDNDEAIVWIINNQLGRRNLALGTRAKLVLKKKEAIAKRAKENQRLSEGAGNKGLVILPNPENPENETDSKKPVTPINTLKILSEQSGVSERSLHNAEIILKEGTEDQIRRLGEGGKGNTINQIYLEVRPKKKKEPVITEIDGHVLTDGHILTEKDGDDVVKKDYSIEQTYFAPKKNDEPIDLTEFDNEPVKKCKICEVEQPLSAFAPDVRAKDGKQGTCRICDNLRSRLKIKVKELKVAYEAGTYERPTVVESVKKAVETSRKQSDHTKSDIPIVGLGEGAEPSLERDLGQLEIASRKFREMIAGDLERMDQYIVTKADSEAVVSALNITMQFLFEKREALENADYSA